MTDTEKPAPLTLTDLDELDRLEREGTGGPWRLGDGNTRDVAGIDVEHEKLGIEIWNSLDAATDAALIVTARNRLPQLLALARVGLLAIEIHDDGVISCIGESRATVAVIEAFRDLIDAYKGGLPK